MGVGNDGAGIQKETRSSLEVEIALAEPSTLYLTLLMTYGVGGSFYNKGKVYYGYESYQRKLYGRTAKRRYG